MRACILFLLILLSPCSLAAFWPVYWELGNEKNLLGPLISYETKDNETHVTFQPLLSSYDSPGAYSILFPLGKSTGEKAYFVPIYMRHSSEHAYDVTLFPFFYGKTAERSYGGVFPFYGRLYHRFRRDEIGFALWPLYSYSIWEGTTRTNILWPFFSFYRGRQEGFKLGPLYGRRRVGDERRSSFVLWPFFIKDEKDLNGDNPQKSLWAFPFYMRTTSPHSSFYAVMWPFFTYMRVQDRTEIKAPWPFFSSAKGKEESGFSLWPIYSHSKAGKDEVTYVLWPIYKETERYPGERKWTQKRILIIDKYETDDRGTFFNICPFFEYRRGSAETVFFFPSIIPWRNAGFDRIIRPLMTLYAYRKKGDKTTMNLLYGFYTKEQEGELWKRRLAFLLEVERAPGGIGFQVLSGLFGLESGRVKIFYIPISRDKAGAAASVDDRMEGAIGAGGLTTGGR
ncbi:MAG: hypothetical protein ABSB94_07015 [Syntrophorhabdales bacterium]|jgi:hypothetical protein